MNRFKLLILSAVLVIAPIVSQASEHVVEYANESFVKIINTVSSAVVVVTVEQPAKTLENTIDRFGDNLEEFGFPEGFLDSLIPQKTPEEEDDEPTKMVYSFGSGFFIDDYIVTNHHVIDGGETIMIHFQNDPTRYEVEVVGSDEIADIAVLRLIDPLPFDVTPLQWSHMQLASGQDVWAIGHPRSLEYSVTKGIISSVNRTASNNWQLSVQTDASVNSGNSGGPLLDMHGKVVAVNTLIITSSGGFEGVSVSVQGDYAQDIITKLLTEEPIDRPLMGIMIAGNIMTGESFVADLVEGSPGEDAGVLTDDIFYSLDGKRILYAQDIYEVLRVHQPGDTISATFLRGDEREQVNFNITFMSMNEAKAKKEAEAQKNLRGE